jgi:hypothetical protein
MLTVLALIHAARTYFVQELLTLLLFLTLAFAMLFLLAVFSLVSAGRAAHSHQGRSIQPARTFLVLQSRVAKKGEGRFWQPRLVELASEHCRDSVVADSSSAHKWAAYVRCPSGNRLIERKIVGLKLE